MWLHAPSETFAHLLLWLIARGHEVRGRPVTFEVGSPRCALWVNHKRVSNGQDFNLFDVIWKRQCLWDPNGLGSIAVKDRRFYHCRPSQGLRGNKFGPAAYADIVQVSRGWQFGRFIDRAHTALFHPSSEESSDGTFNH